MTSPETTVVQEVVVSELVRRIATSDDVRDVAAAARSVYDDLAAVLVPLISRAGVDALAARAVHLTQRAYPSDQPGDAQATEQVGPASVWFERLEPTVAADAAAAMLTMFATLLATLIGQPLTTRYLRKAWPGGFSDTRPEGTQA